LEFVVPDDHEKTIKAHEDILDGIKLHAFENTFFRKDGSVVPLQWSVHWVAEEKLFYCIARDNTNQQKLRELLDAATKMARIGSWEVDLVNDTVYWSDITR